MRGFSWGYVKGNVGVTLVILRDQALKDGHIADKPLSEDAEVI